MLLVIIAFHTCPAGIWDYTKFPLNRVLWYTVAKGNFIETGDCLKQLV